MHGSRASLSHIYRHNFSWKALRQLTLEGSYVCRGTTTCPLCDGCHVVTWRQGPCKSLPHILKPDPEVGGCPGNGLPLYCLFEVHATNRVIVGPLICNRNLACGEGTGLDYCNVIFVAGELGMDIIMLGRIYFMLSCWLAPTNVTPMQHKRRVAVKPQMI
jgi:hypothetical protein